MKKIILFYLLFLTAFSIQINAQETGSPSDYEDVVYLKNGSIYRGKILLYEYDVSLTMKILGGTQMKIPASAIRKIIQERLAYKGEAVVQVKDKRNKEYNFKEKGWYNVTYLDFKNGSNAWDGRWIPGAGIHNVTGYQFNRWIGAGIGVGVDYYYGRAGEIIYPVYAEFRSYFVQDNKSPYATLAAGYGFATKNDEYNISEAEGGFMIHPSFGYRLGAAKNANFTFDVGVKIQKATWNRDWIDWWGTASRQEMVYKRLTLRLGLLF